MSRSVQHGVSLRALLSAFPQHMKNALAIVVLAACAACPVSAEAREKDRAFYEQQRESIKEFVKANPDDARLLLTWGETTYALAGFEKGEARTALLREALEKLEQGFAKDPYLRQWGGQALQSMIAMRIELAALSPESERVAVWSLARSEFILQAIDPYQGDDVPTPESHWLKLLLRTAEAAATPEAKAALLREARREARHAAAAYPPFPAPPTDRDEAWWRYERALTLGIDFGYLLMELAAVRDDREQAPMFAAALAFLQRIPAPAGDPRKSGFGTVQWRMARFGIAVAKAGVLVAGENSGLAAALAGAKADAEELHTYGSLRSARKQQEQDAAQEAAPRPLPPAAPPANGTAQPPASANATLQDEMAANATLPGGMPVNAPPQTETPANGTLQEAPQPALTDLERTRIMREVLAELSSLLQELDKHSPDNMLKGMQAVPFAVFQRLAARYPDAPEALASSGILLFFHKAMYTHGGEGRERYDAEIGALFEKAVALAPQDGSLWMAWGALALRVDGNSGSEKAASLYAVGACLQPDEAPNWALWDSLADHYAYALHDREERDNDGKAVVEDMLTRLASPESEASCPSFAAYARARVTSHSWTIQVNYGMKPGYREKVDALYAAAAEKPHPEAVNALVYGHWGVFLAEAGRASEWGKADLDLIRRARTCFAKAEGALPQSVPPKRPDSAPFWDTQYNYALDCLLRRSEEPLTPELLAEAKTRYLRNSSLVGQAADLRWAEHLEGLTEYIADAHKERVKALLDAGLAECAAIDSKGAPADLPLAWGRMLRERGAADTGEARLALYKESYAKLAKHLADNHSWGEAHKELAQAELALCAVLPEQSWGTLLTDAYEHFTLASGLPADSARACATWSALLLQESQTPDIPEDSRAALVKTSEKFLALANMEGKKRSAALKQTAKRR